VPSLARDTLREPWDWRDDEGNTFANLQSLAKSLAIFLGSKNVTFTIAIAKQRRDIAGRVEVLPNQREIFIEVDDALLRHPACVPAVICHEVMHKVLYDAGLWLEDREENEELTDIACVYGGLGKVMLNGCKSLGYDNKGYESIFTVGYVPRDELAFDYAVICQVRGVVQEQADAYLCEEAAYEVRHWRAQLAPLTELVKGRSELQNDIVRVIETAQSALCERERDIRMVRALLREAMKRIANSHQKINSTQNAIAKLRQGNATIRDLLTGVRAIYLKEILATADSDDKSSVLAKFCQAFSAKASWRNSADHSEIIECPIDGTKLRVPAGKAKIQVLCPKCEYRFLVSTLSEGKRRSLRLFS
jgi:hypothetical protein